MGTVFTDTAFLNCFVNLLTTSFRNVLGSAISLTEVLSSLLKANYKHNGKRLDKIVSVGYSPFSYGHIVHAHPYCKKCGHAMVHGVGGYGVGVQ